MTIKVSVSRQIPAPAADIYDLLSNPHRHPETDSSGSVRSVDQGDRLKEVGDTFVMNMYAEGMGDYQTENEVFAIEEGRRIGWKNLRNTTEDVEVGAKWLWELKPESNDSTIVTLTYDMSEIDDPEIQAMGKENFGEDHLENSLSALAEALA